MDEKYRERYRTTPARLNGWDYGSNGLYFITICTKNRVRYFGEIEEKENLAFLQSTIIGQIANDNWLKIPQYAPFVELEEFVVMPDHVHGIIFINKQDKINWEANKFGPQSRNIASIIRGFKHQLKLTQPLIQLNSHGNLVIMIVLSGMRKNTLTYVNISQITLKNGYRVIRQMI